MNEPELSKQLGMNLGEAHASPDFIQLACDLGRWLAAKGTFTSADLRDTMQRCYPNVSTHDDRALGSVMRRLATEGSITPTGRYVKSNRTRNHNRPMREWVGTHTGEGN